MSKAIRQKIVHAIHSTFRSSSSPQHKRSATKSKFSCCSVTKPQDYEFLPYEPKPSSPAPLSSSHSDYIDLSECQSSSSSKDSGIAFDTNISSISSASHYDHQLQSTRTHSDVSCSLSISSDLSVIPHDRMNISNFDVTAWHPLPQSYQCCHCDCHHHQERDGDVSSRNGVSQYLYVPEEYRTKRSKYEVFPFIL